MATVRVAWSIPNDGGSAITSHVVQRRTGTGTWANIATPAASATFYDDTTAALDTQYGYRHAAVNAIGQAAWSAEKTITPTGGPVVTYATPADPFTTAVSTGWRTAKDITVNASNQAVLTYELGSVLAGPLVDMTGLTVSCEYISHTNVSGVEIAVGIRLDSSNYVVMRLSGTNLRCREMVAGSSSDLDLGTFSATTHKFWRVRHDSGTDEFVWETSADKSTWTERRRKARGFAISANAFGRIGVFRFSGTNTGTFVVDNANS